MMTARERLMAMGNVKKSNFFYLLRFVIQQPAPLILRYSPIPCVDNHHTYF
jgi:hypothetical protein